MHPKRKQRLIVVSFLGFSFALIIGIAMYLLSENINLFYNPTQIAAGEVPQGAKIRAGGMVREGSVVRQGDDLTVVFVLTDYQSDVSVQYTGILPDLFREGKGIVALGRISEQGVLVADEVLAKHDENYMPPEVAEALEKSGHSDRINPKDDTAKDSDSYGKSYKSGSQEY